MRATEALRAGLSLLLLVIAYPRVGLAEPCDRAAFAVALDPGHTPASPGATSARGVPELWFNRQLARTVRDRLVSAGFGRTFLTTGARTEISLTDRTAAAGRGKAQLFVSLHHDSVQPQYLSSWTDAGRERLYSDRYSGYSLFISSKNADEKGSLRLAELLGTEFRRHCLVPSPHHAEAIPGEHREFVDPARGIYRFDDLVVLKTADMPAVLIEAGVIVNRDDEIVLRSSAFRGVMATAIATAVEQFCAREPAAPVDLADCSQADRARAGGARP